MCLYYIVLVITAQINVGYSETTELPQNLTTHLPDTTTYCSANDTNTNATCTENFDNTTESIIPTNVTSTSIFPTTNIPHSTTPVPKRSKEKILPNQNNTAPCSCNLMVSIIISLRIYNIF